MSAPGTDVALGDELHLARPALLRRLIGRAIHLGYRLTGGHRYDNFRMERVRGAHFAVLPSVFNPRSPRTGAFLASYIDPGPLLKDWDVLDMGTGSGVGAVIAARHARRVVAVDLNPAAVRCARVNALLNALEHRIDIRQGDLFAPVHGERFDLVLFNPPFLRAPPRDERDWAWRSTDVAERFATGLAAHLSPGGLAIIVLSTFGHGARFLREFRRCDFRVTTLAERRYINENLTLFGVSA